MDGIAKICNSRGIRSFVPAPPSAVKRIKLFSTRRQSETRIVENVLLHLMQRKMKHLIGLRRVFIPARVCRCSSRSYAMFFPSAIIRKWWFSTNCLRARESFEQASENGKVSKENIAKFCSASRNFFPRLLASASPRSSTRTSKVGGTVNEQKFIQIKSHSRWINQSLEGNVPTTRRHLVHQLYWLEFRKPERLQRVWSSRSENLGLPRSALFFREIKLKPKKKRLRVPRADCKTTTNLIIIKKISFSSPPRCSAKLMNLLCAHLSVLVVSLAFFGEVRFPCMRFHVQF